MLSAAYIAATRRAGFSRNVAMVIDNALVSKMRRAEKLLYPIQSVFTEQTAFWVVDDQMQKLVLNPRYLLLQ